MPPYLKNVTVLSGSSYREDGIAFPFEMLAVKIALEKEISCQFISLSPATPPFSRERERDKLTRKIEVEGVMAKEKFCKRLSGWQIHSQAYQVPTKNPSLLFPRMPDKY